MKNIYLDYNQISLSLDSLAEEIKREGFDALVIILRGGSFPGFHLAFLTGLPYYFLTYDRISESADWKGAAPSLKKVLLVEDFAGMGKTLISSREFLTNQGMDVRTLVICKDPKSASVPDYFCFETRENNVRFILPWERFRLNPAESRVSRAENIADHQFERTLWDETLFSFVREGDGIAAGHIDKGEMAISLGFTHVVTVNVEEAILISSQYPELRVAWWDGERRFMIQSKAV
ncbi:phosphoribosyltransferase [Bacillus infantis]|uniref:phosphoribosyltransferase n=1 Tax=Bacillus infantis TaxID=324767 RepID=UPI003CE73FF4